MWEALLPTLYFLILGVDAHANMVPTKSWLSIILKIGLVFLGLQTWCQPKQPKTTCSCFPRSGRTYGLTRTGQLVSSLGASVGPLVALRSFSLSLFHWGLFHFHFRWGLFYFTFFDWGPFHFNFTFTFTEVFFTFTFNEVFFTFTFADVFFHFHFLWLRSFSL